MLGLPLVQRLIDLCPLRRDAQIVIADEDVDAVEECAEQVALRAVDDAVVQLGPGA